MIPVLDKALKNQLRNKWDNGVKTAKKLLKTVPAWRLVRTNLTLVRTRLLTSDHPGLVRISLDTSLERKTRSNDISND